MLLTLPPPLESFIRGIYGFRLCVLEKAIFIMLEKEAFEIKQDGSRHKYITTLHLSCLKSVPDEASKAFWATQAEP